MEAFNILDQRELARNQLIEIAGHHRHLAAPVPTEQAVVGHRSDLLVGRREFGQSRDVADHAVLEMGPRDDLLLAVRMLQNASRRGQQFQVERIACPRRRRRGALGDPLPQHVVRVVGRPQLQSAAMRHDHRRLEQQQALCRIDAIDAAALSPLVSDQLVHRVVVGLQRQLKAALAAGRSVAGAGVATLAGERRHCFRAKRNWGAAGRSRRRRLATAACLPATLHRQLAVCRCRRGCTVPLRNRRSPASRRRSALRESDRRRARSGK